VPPDLKRIVAYDLTTTLPLLTTGWTDQEAELAADLPPGARTGLMTNLERPEYAFMNDGTWLEALRFLLAGFRLGDEAWESLAFRLWLTRVLSYTTGQAQTGYDGAIEYLERTIRDYERFADQS
jgi:hypothetical protein